MRRLSLVHGGLPVSSLTEMPEPNGGTGFFFDVKVNILTCIKIFAFLMWY